MRPQNAAAAGSGGDLAAFLAAAARWAASEPAVDALLLVGSHARGTARPDSDVDLVVVGPDRDRFLADPRFPARFGPVAERAVEDYGACLSLRVHYRNGLEIEFGFVAPSWILTEPTDEGTRKVLSDGFRVLVDKRGWFRCVSADPAPGPGGLPKP